MRYRPIHVLLVEDNPADADLTVETFAASRFHVDMSVVTDGIQAVQFLTRTGPHAGARRPDLVLLDLNLPKLDGRSVLAEVKGHQDLRDIPIVILTSSDADRDVARSYSLGANCYVKKPVDLYAFQEIVHAIEGFWFTVVRLPSAPGRV